jgi:hypothetical protein
MDNQEKEQRSNGAPSENREQEGPQAPVEPGTVSFRFSAVPEELGEWDITFNWADDVDPFASFTLWFGAGQNMGGDPPIDGWICWVDEELLLAFYDPSGPSHDAIRIPGAAPAKKDEEDEVLRDPQRWLTLARKIVSRYMQVDD